LLEFFYCKQIFSSCTQNECEKYFLLANISFANAETADENFIACKNLLLKFLLFENTLRIFSLVSAMF
jgi:hypothetical protein